MNYYNEFDRHAAAWIRQLIADGLIPDGDVDERSITEIKPKELNGYTQCHFFAGVAGWSLSLQLAGWPADRPVWTGSCPCQPFSVAGKRKGTDDERHLWPAFRDLIGVCRPPVVFGEQVASADGREWLAGIRADLEALGYAAGSGDLCAAGVGAPHIRPRLYWGAVRVSNAKGIGRGLSILTRGSIEKDSESIGRGEVGSVGMGNGISQGSQGQRGHEPDRDQSGRVNPQSNGSVSQASSNGNSWADYELIHFTDGKTRRIKPGIAPLVDGLPRGVVPSSYIGMAVDPENSAEARAMRIKGYGNAIVPELAAVFIEEFDRAAATL